MKNYEKKYKEALERAKTIYQGNSYKPDIAATIAEILQNIFPEIKEDNEDKNNIRPLSSMTNVERQEWGLILADELEEDPYSWLVRHNFLEDKEINIGLSKNLKGPNPPIYL